MNPFRFFCCEKGDKLRDIAWFAERESSNALSSQEDTRHTQCLPLRRREVWIVRGWIRLL